MREIRMDQMIVKMRKERGITQGELAKVMGVSKASVSKWETGGSFPDISLLPRLASYFRISIDELMAYSPQMPEKEINETFARLEARILKENVDAVLEECRELARDYSGCFPVLLQMVLFYVNCIAGMNEKIQKEIQKEVLGEALELCQRIRETCDDMAIRKQAAGLEGACLLLLDQPEKVLELLGDGVAVLSRDECMISLAYQSIGERKKAGKVLQVSIYQHMMAVVDDLISYLYLNGDNRAVFQETWGRLEDMFEIFHLKTLRPEALLQAYMVAAGIASRNGEDDMALKLLEHYLELYRTANQGLQLHGDEFFDETGSWLEETVMNSGLMRSQRAVQKDAMNGMLEGPDFERLRNHPGFQEIQRQLEIANKRIGKESEG